MNELSNSVKVVGVYNKILTFLTSNITTVNLINELTITKAADKQNWRDGFLTYIMAINNKNNTNFFNSVIIDIIDTTLVDFVENSISINSRPASGSEYSYDSDTHILKINLEEIAANTDTIVTFRIKKKYNRQFYLKSNCIFTYNNKTINSNTIIVRSYMVIPRNFSFDCKSLFWRC